MKRKNENGICIFADSKLGTGGETLVESNRLAFLFENNASLKEAIDFWKLCWPQVAEIWSSYRPQLPGIFAGYRFSLPNIPTVDNHYRGLFKISTVEQLNSKMVI